MAASVIPLIVYPINDAAIAVKQNVNGIPTATHNPARLLRKINNIMRINMNPIIPFKAMRDNLFRISMDSSSRRTNLMGVPLRLFSLKFLTTLLTSSMASMIP